MEDRKIKKIIDKLKLKLENETSNDIKFGIRIALEIIESEK